MTKIGSRIWMLSLAVLVAAAAAAMGQTAEAGKMTAMHKGTEVIWPAGDLKWVDAPNAPPGVKQVILWGDSTKGHFAALQKLPAGLSVPLHSHSANLHLIVISGTVVHTPEGKADVRLPANSYLMDPSGYKHATKCEAAADCVFFLEGDGKFDIVMADKK